jgi:UDP-N-acetylmuramate--alanine ligase
MRARRQDGISEPHRLGGRLVGEGQGQTTMQMPRDIGPFHIIGIGGIGMSAIAEILLAKGYSVQGSDQKDSANVRRLRAKGIRVFIGHDGVNLIGARQVVISTAVKRNNPEFEAARAKGLPIIRRAEMLAELMRLYSTVSVTGTHGKTTTTSIISTLFEAGNLDPTVITGGIINAWGSNARLGKGQWMIVEADESDGTFTRLPTEIGVVTNIDPEHLDYFRTVENMHREYEAFYRNIPFYGLAVTCIDHPVVRDMVDRLDLKRDGRRLLTYGASENADLILRAARTDGRTMLIDADLGARVKGGARSIRGWQVPIPGHHNALNALAAIAVAAEAGLSDDVIRSGLASFSGVKRRFQLTGTWNGIQIYDDYGHHPAEIAAVLQAARAGARGRVIAVVEPHRYTRVRDLFRDFTTCFTAADNVIVAPMYTAGESPIDGIDQQTLAEGIRAAGHPAVALIDDPRELVGLIRRHGRQGDTVILLGAGNSTEWAHALPEWLAQAEPRRAGSAM